MEILGANEMSMNDQSSASFDCLIMGHLLNGSCQNSPDEENSAGIAKN